MKKNSSLKKTRTVLGIVMSSLIMATLGVSSFAYWQKDYVEVSMSAFSVFSSYWWPNLHCLHIANYIFKPRVNFKLISGDLKASS